MWSSASGPRGRTAIDSRERHIRVARTARYHVLGDAESAREVWFVLHGYRQLARRFIRRFGALAGAGEWRAIVAPEALSRFYIEDGGREVSPAPEMAPHDADSRVGATWMTRADREHEIRDYVEYLDRLAEATLSGGAARVKAARPSAASVDSGGRRVVVLGFSQGAETASRWATYGRIRPAELVLWAGGLAEDLDPMRASEALAPVRVRFVVGDEDRWAAQRSASSERRLRELGLEPERIGYRGGHEIAAEALREHWGA